MDQRMMRKLLKEFLPHFAAMNFDRFQYEFFTQADIENPTEATIDRLWTVLARISGGLR